ncbi:MAG: ATP-binding protein [Prevotella sp.]|nr:ATP-binding protein [Candidatus Prevotella equi]
MRRNPFITNGYAGKEYFCDRLTETETMVDMLTNQNNIALISPRRMGKTDLIRHCLEQDVIRNHYYTFEVDIYSTSSLNDFIDVLGKAVLETLRTKGKQVWEGFLNVLSSVRSEISFDMSGNPVWGLGLGHISNPTTTLSEIFEYLQHADKPCIVAIDEFQQILKYQDGEKIEALLRTYIQRCSNANFIFSGSHRHLMSGMFTTPSRPFYQSVTIMNLHPIPLDKYQEFCHSKFHEAGKHLADDVVEALYTRFNCTTMYLQKVMNMLFSMTDPGDTCTADMIDIAVKRLLDLASDTYETILSQMPEKQRNLFLAISAEGQAQNISGGLFVRKYRLPSSSSVLSAIKGLLDKDFVTQDKGIYSIYDLLFVEWLKMKKMI